MLVFLYIVLFIPTVIVVTLSLAQEESKLRKIEPMDLILGIIAAMVPVINLVFFIFCSWFLIGTYKKRINEWFK